MQKPLNTRLSATGTIDSPALKALRVSENHYRRLFETALDGILLLNADTAQIEDVNPYLIEMLGYSHAELLGKKLWEVGLFADIAQSKELFSELQTKDYVRYEDLSLKTKTGTHVQVEFVSNSYDCEGIKVIQCNIRDITKSKEAGIGLRWKTAFLETLVSTSADGILVVDLEGKKILQNQRIIELWKIPKKIAEDPDDSKQVQFVMSQTVDAKQFVDKVLYLYSHPEETSQDEVVLKDGTILDRYSAPVLDSDGHSYGRIWSFRDITGRKQAQEEIEFKSTILQTQQETSLDAILLVDKNAKIITYNQRFVHLWRLSPKIVETGQDAPVLQSVINQVENQAAFIARVQYLYKHRNDKSHEEILLKDGRVIDRYSAPVIGADDKYYGRVWYFRDITERKCAEESLKNMAAKYHTVFELSSDAIMLLNEKGFFDCNEAALRMFGCPARDDFISNHPAQLSPPTQPGGEDSMSLANQRIATAFKNGSNRFEWMHRRLDGAEFPAEVLLTAMELDGKAVLQAVVRDITKRKATEQELRIAAFAFETQEGMIVTDAETRILRVNQAFTRLTGYSAEDAIGQTPAMLQSGRQDKDFYRELWNTLSRDKYWQGEMWNRRKNGEIYPEWLTITAVTNTQGQVTNYIGAFSDITQHKQNEAEIHNLAFYDPLTGLPNRRLLHDRLQHSFAAGARHQNHNAILFVGLDNFKTLNDTKGHNVGDLLLIEVAKRLQACLRSEDTVARLGGDEFVVMLEKLGKREEQAAAQVKAVGEKILAAINRPYSLKGYEYQCTASIGICLFCHNDDINAEEALKHADAAMYQAKNAGRNTQRFYDPAMQKALEARAVLEIDLRRALGENQFRLYYQMQVKHTSQIFGAEALIRWQHPQRGLIPPLEFIPLAEETGLILPIGQWVLETACAQLKAWEASPLTRDLQIAVNVSAHQFHQPDFVKQVRQTIRSQAINPDRIKLELTESVVLDNIDDTIVKMQALKKSGVRFSMDDFGTGYSSLSYLTQLPLYQLKIDQSFIHNIGVKRGDAAIVQTIIGMANNLGMEVIAEGVETEKQRAFLEQHGCTLYQGYLFGKPVPVEEFEAKLKSLSKNSPSPTAGFIKIGGIAYSGCAQRKSSRRRSLGA